MSIILRFLFMSSLLACAGCGANGSAQGSGNEGAGAGHVRLGVPF